MNQLLNEKTANYFAIFTMISWGISNGFMKIPSLRLGSSKAIRLRQITMLFSLLLYITFISNDFIFNELIENSNWTIISISLGVFGYLPFYFFCQAIQIGSIGIVNAISNSFPVITVILSSIVYNLNLTIGSVIGIIITAIGVIILSLSRNKGANATQQTSQNNSNNTKSIIYSMFACLTWGGFYTVIPSLNSKLDPIPFTICLQFGTFISAHVHSMFNVQRKNIPSKSLKFAILAGITAVLGSVSFYSALHFGNSAVITAIAGSSPLVVALFGKFAYKEKISLYELFGIFITIIGVLVLTLFKN